MTSTAAIEVAVNLLWCDPGRVGGSEEYLVRQLLGVLEAAPDRVRATLFAFPSLVAAHPELGERFTVVSPATAVRRPRTRIAAEHTWLASRTARRRPRFDVVHHGGGTAPLVGPRPVLLTIHDLQYLRFPEYVSPGKLRYLRFMVPRSIRGAAAVATPTDYVRSTVVEAYGAAPDRVVVVPHGVPTRSAAARVDEEGLRVRYGLGRGPVVVYPAITHPHKNHRLLLDVMARHWTEPDLRLVLLGGPGSADLDVSAAIAALGLAARVVRPGRVPDADRDGLLAIADVLAFPSRYEGFGAPLIEAMVAGTPILCGEHPAIQEVVGDAGIVLADDPDAWGPALAEARRRRAELVAAGRRRVAGYSIATSGAALATAYEAARR